MGVEPKILVPQNGWIYFMENLMNKWDDLGVFPYFWKHPYNDPCILRFHHVLDYWDFVQKRSVPTSAFDVGNSGRLPCIGWGPVWGFEDRLSELFFIVL